MREPEDKIAKDYLANALDWECTSIEIEHPTCNVHLLSVKGLELSSLFGCMDA